MATTKVGLTPAQKRKVTRERKKLEAVAAYEYRDQMFESMTDEERSTMCDRLEEIKDEYNRRMEEFEEELLNELHEEFVAVKDQFSFDVVKSYTESDFNGRFTFAGYLNLEQWADEYKDETGFETESEIAARKEGEAYLAKFLAAGKKLDALEEKEAKLVAQFDERGNFVGTVAATA